jgi:cobalt-zinc-cadmium efflux system outer membrane protein
METMMGPMNTWGITQEIKFPTKYLLMGAAQSSRAESSRHQLSSKKLEVRKKVIDAYYNLFSVQRIYSLLEAQRETLIEVARSAEARHSTGAVPQQDEMKAHVEQTKIEAELLNLLEERETAEATLNALLNREVSQKINLGAQDIPEPKLTVDPEMISDIAKSQSQRVKSIMALSEEADTRKSLAGWNFAPDFAISYRKAWTSAPANNYAFGVEISVPLWFFVKQTGEYSSASAQAVEAAKNVEQIKLEVASNIRSVLSKVKSHEKLLQIYKTSLVPQATSTLNSSRTAYQAGRINFLEFLDSERSLYEVRIAQYRTLTQYVEFLTRLEEVSSASLSSLPFGGI